MSNLRNKAKAMNILCAVMEGKEKGDLDNLIGQIITINDYDFAKDNEKGGVYVCFSTVETPDLFYFGGQVLTEKMSEFDQADKEEIRKDGLPTIFGKRPSKNQKGQAYTTVMFFPEEKDIERVAQQIKDTEKELKGKKK